MITVGTDTYISLTDANSYVVANYVSTASEYTTWSALEDGDKEIYLKKATKRIDRQILRGKKASDDQTLAFPRSIYSSNNRNIKSETAFYYSGWITESEVSQAVKDAQVEEALALMQGEPERLKLQREGVKSFSLGPLSETFSGKRKDLISNEAKELLKKYLQGSFPTC